MNCTCRSTAKIALAELKNAFLTSKQSNVIKYLVKSIPVFSSFHFYCCN